MSYFTTLVMNVIKLNRGKVSGIRRYDPHLSLQIILEILHRVTHDRKRERERIFSVYVEVGKI